MSQALLPKYYEHCKARPSTLLTRSLGLRRVKPARGFTASPVAVFACLHWRLEMCAVPSAQGGRYVCGGPCEARLQQAALA